jgi:hypothetical protein
MLNKRQENRKPNFIKWEQDYDASTIFSFLSLSLDFPNYIFLIALNVKDYYHLSGNWCCIVFFQVGVSIWVIGCE